MRNLILLLVGIWFAGPAMAQQPDSTGAVALPDSTAAKLGLDTAGASIRTEKNPFFLTGFFAKNYPSPGKAALLSLVLPGAGQAYNKKWWKLPIVYVGLGGLTWLEVSNIRNYREARDNYKWFVDGDPNTNVIPAFEGADATSLREYRDIQRRYVEQSSLVLGLAYLLTATDAFVDAHLSRFDVGEDLSLRLAPKTQAIPGFGLSFGFGVSLQFGRQDPKEPPPVWQTGAP